MPEIYRQVRDRIVYMPSFTFSPGERFKCEYMPETVKARAALILFSVLKAYAIIREDPLKYTFYGSIRYVAIPGRKGEKSCIIFPDKPHCHAVALKDILHAVCYRDKSMFVAFCIYHPEDTIVQIDIGSL